MTWMRGFATQRGPITEYREMAEGGLALCVCEHGKEWPEGALLESAGGSACDECVERAVSL